MDSNQKDNNFMSTININNSNSNKNDPNDKESHNRNLTTKEIYTLFGPLMITHKLIELDDNFKKYILMDSISLAPEDKKLISREISDKIQAEIKAHDYVAWFERHCIRRKKCKCECDKSYNAWFERNKNNLNPGVYTPPPPTYDQWFKKHRTPSLPIKTTGIKHESYDEWFKKHKI